MINATRLFPPRFFLRSPSNDDLPAFIGERRILVASKVDEDTKILYDNFYEILSTYLTKVPNTPAKAAVKKLHDRGLIYIGRDITGSGKNGIIGTFLVTRDKLAAVVVESIELEIDPTTGETSNIDGCFYAAYYEFIRAAVILNEPAVKANRDLHRKCTKYLFYIMLRLVGASSDLNSKQRSILQVLVDYFYFRFLVGQHHDHSKEFALKDADKELAKEISGLFTRLERYQYMKDIFKGLVDFGITLESPNVVIIRALTKFKPTVFYSLTTSLDYIIALAIVSRYPVNFLQNALVNGDLQSEIEEIVYPYLNKVGFDVAAAAKL